MPLLAQVRDLVQEAAQAIVFDDLDSQIFVANHGSRLFFQVASHFFELGAEEHAR